MEWTILGNPAWSTVSAYDNKLNISAIDSAMSDVSMQCCDPVTAVMTGNGQVQLLGVWKGCYSPTLTDNEAVVDNHLIKEASWNCLWLPSGEEVPLEYNTKYYKMYICCCKPTILELQALPVYWVECHIEDLAIDSGHKSI
eukprot:11559367-Ditylum_brightwellii.AAC.1